MKQFAIILLCLTSLLLQGCATAILTGSTPDNTESSQMAATKK